MYVVPVVIAAVLAAAQGDDVYPAHSISVGSPVNSVAALGDSDSVLSGSRDGSVLLWNVSTGQLENNPMRVGLSYVFSVAVNGIYLAEGGGPQQQLFIWEDYESGSGKNWSLQGHTGDVNAVAFSPDGRYLASGSDDKTIRLWDPKTRESLLTLSGPSGHTDAVTSVAFSSGGSLLASGSFDQTIKVWDPTSGRLLNTLTGHTDVVNSVAYSPDGKWLASGSDDGTILMWEPTTGQAFPPIQGPEGEQVLTLAFCPIYPFSLAAGYSDHLIRTWGEQSFAPEHQFRGHTNWVRSVAYSPDGRYLISGGDDKYIRVWTVPTSRGDVVVV